MFRHCREHAPYEPVASLGRVSEVACYLGKGEAWGEVRTYPRGFYVQAGRAVPLDRGGKGSLSATYQDRGSAIAKLLEFVKLIEEDS